MRTSHKPSVKLRNPWQFFATSFGVSCTPGKIPRKIPGTMGTIPAIGLWWLMAVALSWSTEAMIWTTALLFILGLPIVHYASDGIGVYDDGRITWDEIVGYFCAALFAPSGFGWLLLAFVLFRYFDMLKPWPVNRFDIRHGVFWVMVDDVIGGVLAGLLLWWFATEWRIALTALGGHLTLMLLGRLILRYDRKQRGIPFPSIGKALGNPQSAWE
ncbi:hypothetical protein A3A64_04550 [Candidatus Gottesmanbacteria bacterium RIFCSPLOWO2_01_FULL_48_11]|uniref:YutG/PgpA domain-containing protein n=2 Tax=Patescibacteria group TaxID=1783273 RepID=A0A1F6ASG4_9BACT|nr:MAG: Phosphatidylglycerophosphatase A [Parcubacteria group bacterium GW2011_GWA1_47_11]OGG27629.1 MAG: hypothetical protein A3A64_04550 [Candidatus Gottesmanbacteria bacterium RIFCSPLOWO2_01_FULL_48_11]